MSPRAKGTEAPGRNGRRSKGFYGCEARQVFSKRTDCCDGSFCRAAGLRLALLLLALVLPGAVAQATVETPRTIRVVVDNTYPPFSFQSNEGKLQGILIDQWQAWERKTGIKVEMHAMDWGEALQSMRAGEFDVIDNIVETPERRGYFDFTPAYATIETSIFFRKDISGITDPASLKGFAVGVEAGDQQIDRLKANGVTAVIQFQNDDALIESAKQRKINVFVIDNSSALYLLNKAGIDGEFRQSSPIFRDELRRAVRKGDTALLREVSDGFAAIEPGELTQINEKWFGRTINRIGQYLTYAGYAAAAALLIIAGLTAWNRTLRQKVLQRTAALRESEQRFRRLVELMPVAVYVCDTEGRIQSYNRRAVELWGREPKPGDTAQRYCASLHLYSPEGKLVPHDESKMAEVLRTGVPAHDLEEVIERPDGLCITVLVNTAPLRDGKGELVGAMNCFQDITERKQAEDALNAQALRYKTLLATSMDSIYVLDEKGDLQEANAAFLRRRGYTAADVKGLNVADWDAQWSREQLQERMRKLVGSSAVFETRHRCKDGSIFDVEICATGVQIDGEQLFFAVTRDIAERKQAEQALRESETKFRRLLASNITGVIFWTLDGDISGANDRFLNMVGYTREDLHQGRLSWKKLTPPEYAPVDQKAIGELTAAGTCVPFEKQYIRKDGSRVSVLIGSALLEPHKDAGSSFVMDITERKRVELALDERLRFETLLTELSATFANLATKTVDQEIDKWLQNLVEFLDLDRAILDQVGEDGRTLSRSHSHTVRGIDVFPLDVANNKAPWITEQLLLGNTVKWSRIPDDIPQQAGKEREFAGRIGAKSLLSIPVCIGGSVICAVSFTSLRTYRDWPDEMVARLRLVGEIFANAITRKRAAKELEEANHQLRFLSRRLFHVQEEERRHLARELHDEVGQALTAAKINLQAAIKESDGAKSKRIDETAAILEKLLGQVRQISLDLRPSTLDDLGLVPALRSLLDQQGRRASVAVHLSAKNVPENLNAEIQTTCFRIAQEAITNAVRHANATRIDVDLRCENGNLRLRVRDNGRGFDADAVQAQAGGLGLIGMKERAVLVDARAKIISSPNNGTTVEVSLPLAFPPERESRVIGQ